MASEQLLTWEDIVHLPEKEMPELIDGRPYLRAAPRGRHSFLQGELPPFDAAVLTMSELFGPLPKGWPGP